MTTQPQSTSLVAVLSRIFWMMLGPMVLVVLALVIVQTSAGWLTAVDIAFLAILAGMLLARWLEFRHGEPQTATGEPATVGHLRRYLLSAVVIGLGAWVVANLLGNHWL